MRLAILLLAGCGRIGFGASDPVGDAAVDAPACFAVDDSFDAATLDPSWRTFAGGGATTPTAAGGEVVLDVGAVSKATSELATQQLDLRTIIATVTVRDFSFVTNTQVFFELGSPTREFAVLVLATGEIRARIQLGNVLDDTTVPFATGGRMRFRLATSQLAGGTEIVWSAAPSETDPFVELRRQTVADPFDDASISIAYQTFADAPTDPPPLTVDDFRIEIPCP